MTSRGLIFELSNLLSLLIESEIALVINPVAETRVSRATRVTWTKARQTSGVLSGLAFATVDEYCALVEQQMYSAVLYDGALLQISYDFHKGELAGHRLCYYPCPFNMDDELLQSEPFGEVVALYRESEGVAINLRSPCRFDYDERNVDAGDPCVHMHVVVPHCRWPVTRPLGLGDFVRFIFRHFYPNIWFAQSFVRTWPRDRVGRRTINPEEEAELHIACGRG